MMKKEPIIINIINYIIIMNFILQKQEDIDIRKKN